MSSRWRWFRIFPSKQYTSLAQSEAPEKEQLSASRRKGTPFRPSSSRITVTYALLGLWLTSLSYLIFLIFINVIAKSSSSLPRTPVPNFPTETKLFQQHPLYFQAPSPETDAAWGALMGPESSHRGFISIQNSQGYGIHPGAPSNGKELYGVSMLHQLHCLASIRKTFFAALNGDSISDEHSHHHLDDHPANTTSPTGLGHIQHCFDYIRQGIQCAGDLSLEWPSTQADGTYMIDGWSIPHTCKSWDQVWGWVEDMKV